MDEYISKQNVLDYLNGYLHSLGEGGADSLLFDRGQRRALINSIQDILAIKAKEVQPVKHGKWDFQGYQLFKCTNCTKIYTQEQLENMGENWTFPNFCPNCGARMDGEQNEVL